MTIPQPPTAARIPHTHTIHGDERVDDYHWLREKGSAAVTAYLEAENAYAEAMTEGLASVRETLYAEMLGRIKEDDDTVPYREGPYFYYSRTEKGRQYPLLCRKRDSLEAPEEVYLDLNALAEGHPFLSIGPSDRTSDGSLLAYGVDTTGFREYDLRIQDLGTGERLPDRLGMVREVRWAGDDRTLFYIREDAAKRAYRLYRHVLGADPAADELLYEETDELFRISLERSRSRAYLFLTAGSFTSSEVRWLPAHRPLEAFRLIRPREPDHEYYAAHHGNRFYLRTNDRGRNFRLVWAPVDSPGAGWEEVIPHRPDVMLSGVELFRRHLVACERREGLPVFRVISLETGEEHPIEFPEPTYSASPEENREWDAARFRFRYESLITPTSVYDHDMETRQNVLLKRNEVLGGFDPTVYASERLWAKAEDGARIPVSLVYRKELERNGQRPLLLYGYGSYGYPLPVTFSSSRLSLLDRGVVYAMAHIRGGGEMGKPWHDRGKMGVKRNTFTDFVASAEHLVREGYTSPDRLAISGGSAGGLLMGAVISLRPDLFRAVLSYVPFVDVINTMLDASLPLTVGEYLEWGNPNVKADYDYMKSYCPYTNLEAKGYPAMLLRTSLNDSQVMYWEPAKYVAKLRTLKTDQQPLLLKTNMGAGHGGASGRYDSLRDLAWDYAFLLEELGLT